MDVINQSSALVVLAIIFNSVVFISFLLCEVLVYLVVQKLVSLILGYPKIQWKFPGSLCISFKFFSEILSGSIVVLLLVIKLTYA